MSAPPAPHRAPPRFQLRFTLGLLYLFGFWFLYCMLIVAPPLWELWQTLPPQAQNDELALRAAAERAQQAVQPRLLLALAAAAVTTALLSYARLLPGTGRGR
jgi:hypothetical protein